MVILQWGFTNLQGWVRHGIFNNESSFLLLGLSMTNFYHTAKSCPQLWPMTMPSTPTWFWDNPLNKTFERFLKTRSSSFTFSSTKESRIGVQGPGKARTAWIKHLHEREKGKDLKHPKSVRHLHFSEFQMFISECLLNSGYSNINPKSSCPEVSSVSSLAPIISSFLYNSFPFAYCKYFINRKQKSSSWKKHW